MRLLGIDPGMRNLAFVAMENGKVENYGRIDIFGGTPIDRGTVYRRIDEWCVTMKSIFEWADLVVIEKQFVDRKVVLSECLIVIQTVLQERSVGKNIVVPAMSIKRYFDTYKGNHVANKKASVELVRTMWELDLTHNKKVDDLADAYLLALFAHRQFSNRVSEACPKPSSA